MEGGKKLWMKVLLDLLTLALIVGSWCWYIVDFAQGFQVGVGEVRLHTRRGKLDVYVAGSYEDFCAECPSTSSANCSKVCTNFHSAAACYLVLSGITVTLILASVLNLLSLVSGCLCCLALKFQFTHYACAFCYALALLLYAILSGFLALDASVGPGLIAMLAAQVCAVLSLFLFCLVRRDYLRYKLLKHKPTEGEVSLAEVSHE